MLVRIINREDPDQTVSSEAVFFKSSLIWVCLFVPVCLGLFGRQLVFKILEHLPYVTRGTTYVIAGIWEP